MKRFLFLFLILTYPLMAFDLGGYTITCHKCRDSYQRHRGYTYCTGCHTWRCYAEEGRDKDVIIYNEGKAQLVHLEGHWFKYRCKHGHTLYVKSDGTEMR